jgi:hypothetical protein
VRRWAEHRVERRVRRELAAWDPHPEVRLSPLFGFERPRGPAATQHFRSLVQVNFYARPR